LLSQQLPAFASRHHFHQRFASLTDELSLNLTDLCFGGFEFDQRNLSLKAQSTGDRKALRKTNFDFALARVRVTLDGGFKIRVGEATGLSQTACSFADTQARSREIGILSMDASADACERDDDCRLRV
jgi:hypothetical protein